MLALRTPPAASTFTKRDLRRLMTAALFLVLPLTGIFALDLLPQRLEISVNDVAPSDIVAPRKDSYVSQIETQAARDEARKSVPPVYDFSDKKAARVATPRVGEFERIVRPIDAASAPDTPAETRQELLASVD